MPGGLPAALADARAYPHRCDPIRVVETHISWVFLTGPFAYKVKKPVDLGFVDFSTLARREHFCREELRCNAAFAPELYAGVTPIVEGADGLIVRGDGEPIEWAVQMVQFDGSQELDRLVAADDVTREELRAFGRELASVHAARPRPEAPLPFARVREPMLDDFTAIRDLREAEEAVLVPLEAATRSELARREPVIRRRLDADGFVRECHGDLHLANLVRTEHGIRAFDALEFDPSLRWIDVISDAAFLVMDLSVRGRADLAYAFLDGWLEAEADYEGAGLLPLHLLYRAMVRAKVAAIRHHETGEEEHAATLRRHLDWATELTRRPPGRLVITCGVSGAGKSHLARRLLEELPAVRLRSDVLRKRQAGLASRAGSGSGLDTGLYSPERTRAVYDELAEHAGAIVGAGENVIADATFLEREERERFAGVARRAGAPFTVLWCDAPPEVLRARVAQRSAEGTDVSEAGPEVLEAQLARFAAPGDEALRVDTGGAVDVVALAATLRESG